MAVEALILEARADDIMHDEEAVRLWSDQARWQVKSANLARKREAQTAKRAALQARLDARCCAVGSVIRLNL